MKIKQLIVLLNFLGVIFFVAPVSAANTNNTVEDTVTAKDVQRFGEALEIVKRYYVEDIPNEKLFDNALRGLLNGLDPHSTYLDQEELNGLKDVTAGKFSGLGIEITPADGYLKVITPLDDSSAQKAGIKAGDYLIKINDELIRDMTLGDAIKKMRGPKGSTVYITIVRPHAPQPIKLKVIRDEVKVESVKSKMLTPGYAYLRISNFQEDTLAELNNAVQNLQKQAQGHIKGLILDVRNNPGGLLEPAVKVADAFLNSKKLDKNGVIVSAKGRFSGADFVLKADPNDLLPGVPMVVLINNGSASGAEIVAGALHDYQRAVLVGTQTFGKGSVQTVIPLDEKSAVKLTTALYYTPSGRSIQAEGIRPDVDVEDIEIPVKAEQTNAEKIYIKEADLKGHLMNGDKDTDLSANDLAKVAPDEKELVNKDYQLFVALNVLKGLVAAQPNKK